MDFFLGVQLHFTIDLRNNQDYAEEIVIPKLLHQVP